MEPGTDPPGDATALKGCLTGGLILLFFALFGERVLAVFGITLPALRTAGGVLLLLIALDMVFARSSGGTTTTTDERAESWLGLSEQVFRIDRWRVCRVQAAAICGSLVK